MSYQKIIIKKILNKEEKREEEEERDIQISLASFNSHTTKTLCGGAKIWAFALGLSPILY